MIFKLSHFPAQRWKIADRLPINLVSTSPLIAKTSWKGWKSKKAWLNSDSIYFSTLLGWFEFVLGIIPVQTLLTTFSHDDHSLWCAVHRPVPLTLDYPAIKTRTVCLDSELKDLWHPQKLSKQENEKENQNY